MKIKEAKVKKRLLSIFTRYILLLLIAASNLWVFYFVFAPLTIYASYFLLDLFFDVSLIGNIIFISPSFPVEIIDACVAGSAYYLLLILNLSIPEIKITKRLKMILFSLFSFFILNVIRILFISILFASMVSWADSAHVLFWYLGSIFFVVLIWFMGVRAFKIGKIPFYSDFKFLSNLKKKR
jgi:exosortase/archaeosortase family protein